MSLRATAILNKFTWALYGKRLLRLVNSMGAILRRRKWAFRSDLLAFVSRESVHIRLESLKSTAGPGYPVDFFRGVSRLPYFTVPFLVKLQI